MSESKRRKAAGHKPADGMVNVSGRHVTDVARGVMDLLEKPFDDGMQADVAAQVLVAVAVDLWRANYGDAQLESAFRQTVTRRLAKSPGYWGAEGTR